MNYFVDAHTHVHFPEFEEDVIEVMKRAQDAGVAIVNVGTLKETSEGAVTFAHAFKGLVFATVGLHPNHTYENGHDEVQSFDYDFYKNLAADSKVLGIGECGLDYYRVKENLEEIKKIQKEVFEQHIKLAHEVQKPLMIHCRDAFGDLISILREHKDKLLPEAGIIHFFSGALANAKDLVELGFSFTFGGVVTFACDYDEVIKWLPENRILSETDAPYVAPMPYRGKRNEPAYVVETVKKLAEIRGVSVDKMKEVIWENAGRVLKLS